MLTLEPAGDEPEITDPAFTGEWAESLKDWSSDGTTPPWCQYFVRLDGAPVGMGGFKSALDARGEVEIAYITFIPARDRGTATAIAAMLVEIARKAGARTICAHTLPETNASTRVLEKNGFIVAGDVDDPDDGRVWRWERAAFPDDKLGPPEVKAL